MKYVVVLLFLVMVGVSYAKDPIVQPSDVEVYPLQQGQLFAPGTHKLVQGTELKINGKDPVKVSSGAGDKTFFIDNLKFNGWEKVEVNPLPGEVGPGNYYVLRGQGTFENIGINARSPIEVGKISANGRTIIIVNPQNEKPAKITSIPGDFTGKISGPFQMQNEQGSYGPTMNGINFENGKPLLEGESNEGRGTLRGLVSSDPQDSQGGQESYLAPSEGEPVAQVGPVTVKKPPTEDVPIRDKPPRRSHGQETPQNNEPENQNHLYVSNTGISVGVSSWRQEMQWVCGTIPSACAGPHGPGYRYSLSGSGLDTSLSSTGKSSMNFFFPSSNSKAEVRKLGGPSYLGVRDSKVRASIGFDLGWLSSIFRFDNDRSYRVESNGNCHQAFYREETSPRVTLNCQVT